MNHANAHHAGHAPLSPLIHLIDDDAAVRDSLALLIGTFFNDTATSEIYTLSLHDALPI